MPNVDANVISFQCPKCGLRQTIGLLISNQRLVCNGCGVGISFDTAKVAKAAKIFEESPGDINWNDWSSSIGIAGRHQPVRALETVRSSFFANLSSPRGTPNRCRHRSTMSTRCQCSRRKRSRSMKPRATTTRTDSRRAFHGAAPVVTTDAALGKTWWVKKPAPTRPTN
jgi:hypothetical protein